MTSNMIGNIPHIQILNISQNNFESIPSELGFIEDLKSLNIEGNLLRSFNRNIIEGSIEDKKKHLRFLKLEDPNDNILIKNS